MSDKRRVRKRRGRKMTMTVMLSVKALVEKGSAPVSRQKEDS
jgi:hypothetical protein